MSMNFYNVQNNKWEQVRFEVENCISLPHVNRVQESLIPVSGVLYKKASLLASQLSSGIIVSALPEQSVAVLPPGWVVSEVPTIRVPMDGIPLCSLGFPKALYKAFRITPFVRNVNRYASDAFSTPMSISFATKSSDDITNDVFCIKGICYGEQKNGDPSTRCSEFLNWTEKQLSWNSSKGAFTAFSAKVEEDVQISFWGAPILTAKGEINSIVVYQQTLGDETVGIVGMKIKPFINSIPLLSTQIASI